MSAEERQECIEIICNYIVSLTDEEFIAVLEKVKNI